MQLLRWLQGHKPDPQNLGLPQLCLLPVFPPLHWRLFLQAFLNTEARPDKAEYSGKGQGWVSLTKPCPRLFGNSNKARWVSCELAVPSGPDPRTTHRWVLKIQNRCICHEYPISPSGTEQSWATCLCLACASCMHHGSSATPHPMLLLLWK